MKIRGHWLNRFLMQLTFVGAISHMQTSSHSVMANDSTAHLRVEISPSLPLDPLAIQTMADYDLTLCLYRTWFEYDEGRKAMPGIVSAWQFDDAGGKYIFTIAPQTKWSDGSPLTSDQLISNLKRAVYVKKDSFGGAISEIVAIEKAKVLSSTKFELPTRNGKPSESFFQRMGSIFLAPIHPSDFDSNFAIKGNQLSSGPYKIESITPTQLSLAINTNDGLAPKERVSIIAMKRDSVTQLNDFILGKSWANILQTATLMPLSLATQVQAKKLPYWTRGIDRVSRLKPLGTGAKLEERRHFLVEFGKVWRTLDLGVLSFNAKRALSLQPLGYPLFNELDYGRARATNGKLLKSIKIVVRHGPQFEVQRPLIEKAAQALGVKVQWVSVKTYAESSAAEKADPEIGFNLISFGVADPEPATWMGLVLDETGFFSDVEKQDVIEFKKMAAIADKAKEIAEFKKLLEKMAYRGSYLPLLHFSTLSIGQVGINFNGIKELDETVDYSKLIVR